LVSSKIVHLLNESRGSRLEAIVSRMELLRKDLPETEKLRILAVSATAPNFLDVAQWLHVPRESAFHFGDEFRPVPLTVRVIGYPPSKNEFIFDRNLNYKLFGKHKIFKFF